MRCSTINEQQFIGNQSGTVAFFILFEYLFSSHSLPPEFHFEIATGIQPNATRMHFSVAEHLLKSQSNGIYLVENGDYSVAISDVELIFL